MYGELNPVEKDDGGTMFITGSHKAAYTAPEVAHTQDWDFGTPIPVLLGLLLSLRRQLRIADRRGKTLTLNRVAIFNAV